MSLFEKHGITPEILAEQQRMIAEGDLPPGKIYKRVSTSEGYIWKHLGRYEVGHPRVRIRRVLDRMSRDRWLLPKECYDIAFKLACRWSGNPRATVRYLLEPDIYWYGLIRGKPVTYTWSANRGKVRELIERIEKSRKNSLLRRAPEIELLKTLGD